MPCNLQCLEVDVGIFQMQECHVSRNRIVDDVSRAEIVVAKDEPRLYSVTSRASHLIARGPWRGRKVQDPQLEDEKEHIRVCYTRMFEFENLEIGFLPKYTYTRMV